MREIQVHSVNSTPLVRCIGDDSLPLLAVRAPLFSKCPIFASWVVFNPAPDLGVGKPKLKVNGLCYDRKTRMNKYIR